MKIIKDKIFLIFEMSKDRKFKEVVDIAFDEKNANDLLEEYTESNNFLLYFCQEISLNQLKEQRKMFGITKS